MLRDKLNFLKFYDTWFIFTFLVWFSGVGGRDLYILPLLIGLIIFTRQKSLDFHIQKYSSYLRYKSAVIYILPLLLLCAMAAKSFSFHWNIYDVGSYASAVYNFSLGKNYNSFMAVPALADHFIPGLIIFAPLFLISPSGLWIIFAKTIAYLATPLVFWFFIRNKTNDRNRLYFSIGFFTLGFYLFYKPLLSALYFQFSPSTLAPPFLVAAFFLLEKRKWLGFLLCSLFILSLKEHMAIVLICLGFYEYLNNSRRVGALLMLIGFMTTVLMIFLIMPYLSQGYSLYQNNAGIEIFSRPVQKLQYLLKLTIPLLFLPVFFWRLGSIALPAIAVNLIAAKPEIITTIYHYDDISGTFLLLASSLAFLYKFDEIKSFIIKLKFKKWIFAVYITLFCILLPASPIREMADSFPGERELKTANAMERLKNDFPYAKPALQGSLGLHWLDFEVSAFIPLYKLDEDSIDYIHPIKPSFESYISPNFFEFAVISIANRLEKAIDLLSSFSFNFSDFFNSAEGWQAFKSFTTTFIESIFEEETKPTQFACSFNEIRSLENPEVTFPPNMLVLAENVGSAFPIDDVGVCIDFLRSSGKYKEIEGYEPLVVFIRDEDFQK